MYENVECKFNKFWVPLVWANSVLTQARKEGRIESEIGFRLIIEVWMLLYTETYIFISFIC